MLLLCRTTRALDIDPGIFINFELIVSDNLMVTSFDKYNVIPMAVQILGPGRLV